MGTRDTEEFGKIVDRLAGRECRRALATNSIKLRFDTEHDPRGLQYIWIEPPWTLYHRDAVLTSSDDYSDESFQNWQRHFDPLNRTIFVDWDERDGRTVFRFANDYAIVVPAGYGDRKANGWLDYWYARSKTA